MLRLGDLRLGETDVLHERDCSGTDVRAIAAFNFSWAGGLVACYLACLAAGIARMQ